MRSIFAYLATAWFLFNQSNDPSLAEALSRIQSNDFPGAAKMLQAITKREPANGRAWRNLGLVYDRLEDRKHAIEAYKQALEVQPDVFAPMYAIAIDYAALKDPDLAFEWLTKAKATKRIDMTQASQAPELAAYKSDSRFAKILPQPADFEHPFVEDVKILREWDGEAANDQFGWIARQIGDVDGDGVPDFVTSAPTSAAGGAFAGRVYVYSTKSGKLLWKVDGHAGDRLGIGIEAAGDTNGDGIPDVIASAPGAGKAYILSGKDGSTLVTLAAEDKGDSFGRHVSTAGDVNGDGFADVFVGAPGHNKGTGAAYVFSGKDGRLLTKFSGEREGDNFGSAVVGITGRNGLLLVVGAPTAGQAQHGRVYVYKSLINKPDYTFDGEPSGQALGAMFLSIPGDFNGDGYPDIFASDFSDNGKAPGAGRIYVHSGKDGKRLFTLSGETPAEGFGTSASTAGDVDGDGVPDLIVGSWQYSVQANSGGRAYLHSGRDGALMKTFTCRIPSDTFGFDAVGMGDTDRDGTVDLLITSAWSGVHGYHSGRIFLLGGGIQKR
jgi:FG-GAP-like repeat/FG-GAP repeat/Tetratricopeptide repeat